MQNPAALTAHQEVRFASDRHEVELIQKIAERAMTLDAIRRESRLERDGDTGRHHRVRTTILDLVMDVSATHANGNRLRLEALLAADEFNFAHDIYGIRANLNRDTGELENFFSPRFSA